MRTLPEPMKAGMRKKAPSAAMVIRDRAAPGRVTRVHAHVLDARLRQSLVSVRALGRAGLAVGGIECAADVPAFGSRWCSVRSVVPDVAQDATRFAQAVLDVLAAYPAKVIIPSHEGSIAALRLHRTEVERSTALALAKESAITVAVDKERTLAVARELGIAVPHGVIVRDVGDVHAAMREIGTPAVVKPLHSWVEREGVATRLECSTVLNEDEAKRTVETMMQAGGSVVLQQWLPGSREAVSLLYARGQLWARFAQVAHRMYPPLGGSSVLRESIALPPDATDAAEKLVRAIDLEGYSEIEFRRDGAGRAVLMEINPRLSASVEIAVRAGVNFPWLVYAWAAGEALEPVLSYRTGVRVRWLGGDLYYLKETYKNQGRPDIVPMGRAIRSFALDFVRPTAYDYMDIWDVHPALIASRQMLLHLARRATQRMRV